MSQTVSGCIAPVALDVLLNDPSIRKKHLKYIFSIRQKEDIIEGWKNFKIHQT